MYIHVILLFACSFAAKGQGENIFMNQNNGINNGEYEKSCDALSQPSTIPQNMAHMR